MALDQVPNHFQTMRIRIMANIGACFIKLNQFEDAVTSYEVSSQTNRDLGLYYTDLTDLFSIS